MAEPFEETGADRYPQGAVPSPRMVTTSEQWANEIATSVQEESRKEEFARGRHSSQQRRALDVADDMVFEYLAFRGFTESFRQLSLERVDDARNRGSYDAKFAVEALLRSVRELDGGRLIEAWEFLESKFFSQLDAELSAHADALRCGIFRYYCVSAVNRREPAKAIALLSELTKRDLEEARGRSKWSKDQENDALTSSEEERAVWALASDEVMLHKTEDIDLVVRRQEQHEEDIETKHIKNDFFLSETMITTTTGGSLARNGRRWREWFAMPHLSEPHKDPVFRLYFSRQWQDDLLVALRNFLATVFARAPPPKLLLLEKWHRSTAQRALRAALLEAQEEQAKLEASLDHAKSARDALAKTLKSLIAHCHHESLRDANRLHRGGLFDDDPDDATRATRQAGAAALDIAKRCEAQYTSDTSPTNRDSDLLALCEAAESYLALLQGGSSASAPGPLPGGAGTTTAFDDERLTHS